MAIKGTESKKIIFNKIQELFPNSFFEEDGKILRIPLSENGEIVEIKCQLTSAKNNLSNTMAESAFDNESTTPSPMLTQNENKEDIEPTQAEKDNVSKLLASLGL